METKELKYNFDYINECYTHIKQNQDKIKKLSSQIEEDQKTIENIIVTTSVPFNQIKTFIAYSLKEAIDKFDLNKDKEDKKQLESISTSCSTDGENIVRRIDTYDNPNSKFDPFIDKWEFYSIEKDNNKYKITVENIKGRKFISGFYWIPDLYSTDWIEL